MSDSSLSTNSRPARLPWDVALFFALYILLPEYFALEFHGSFPLLTGNRAVLIIMGILLLVRNRRLLRPAQWHLGLCEDRFLRWGLLIYFSLLALCHLVLLPADPAEAVKALLVLAAEEYILVWLLVHTLDSRKKLVTALKILVLAAGVASVIAVIGSIIGRNPFHLLNTVQREMLMVDYIRLGMLRAAAGFGHPVFYGAFCVMIVPLTMYAIEHSDRWWEKLLYAACLIADLVGLFFSNSRGSLMIFVVLAVLLVILCLVRKALKKLICTFLPVALAALAIAFVVSTAASPLGPSFLVHVTESVFDSFLVTDSAGSEEVEYGENENGSLSRLKQLSGIEWTLSQKPLFGFGSNAHVRGLIKYQYAEDIWGPTATFDMGPVAIICQYGLVGLAAFIALFCSLLKTTLSRKYLRDPLMPYLCLCLIAYGMNLLSIASLNKYLWVLVGLIVCLVNIIAKESRADLPSGE